MKPTTIAKNLAKMMGDSEAGGGKYFAIIVNALDKKDEEKARYLEYFLNVRYNQLYKKIWPSK